MNDREPSAVSVEEIAVYFETLGEFRPTAIIEDVAKDWVQARLPVGEIARRPGGFVPGPALMGLVDYVGWVLVFTRLGITPMAVTWDLKINFLRPAVGADVIIEGRQTKFGTFTHATYDLWLEGSPDRLTAHATTTYALPSESTG